MDNQKMAIGNIAQLIINANTYGAAFPASNAVLT